MLVHSLCVETVCVRLVSVLTLLKVLLAVLMTALIRCWCARLRMVLCAMALVCVLVVRVNALWHKATRVMCVVLVPLVSLLLALAFVVDWKLEQTCQRHQAQSRIMIHFPPQALA